MIKLPELTEQEMNTLNLLLGVALGYYSIEEADKHFAEDIVQLVNKLNRQNPGFTQYLDLKDVKRLQHLLKNKSEDKQQ